MVEHRNSVSGRGDDANDDVELWLEYTHEAQVKQHEVLLSVRTTHCSFLSISLDESTIFCSFGIEADELIKSVILFWSTYLSLYLELHRSSLECSKFSC